MRLYAVTDLPEPLSPTIPKTSPSFRRMETSFNALTSPAGVKKESRSFLTSTRYSPISNKYSPFKISAENAAFWHSLMRNLVLLGVSSYGETSLEVLFAFRTLVFQLRVKGVSEAVPEQVKA